MKNIPTASEYVSSQMALYFIETKDLQFKGSRVHELMIEFAKLHVEAALKAVNEAHYKIRVGGSLQFPELLGHKSLDERLKAEKGIILLAYPLELIK